MKLPIFHNSDMSGWVSIFVASWNCHFLKLNEFPCCKPRKIIYYQTSFLIIIYEYNSLKASAQKNKQIKHQSTKMEYSFDARDLWRWEPWTLTPCGLYGLYPYSVPWRPWFLTPWGCWALWRGVEIRASEFPSSKVPGVKGDESQMYA